MVDELRRAYHDRIGELHVQTVALVGDASAAVAGVTSAFLDKDREAAAAVAVSATEAGVRVVAVEAEVLDLLAQQAPVARDLRLVLAGLRIAQIADLCFGLAGALAGRVWSAAEVLTPALRDLMGQMGAESAALLERADQAWRVVDERLAAAVVSEAERSRGLQRRFLAELIGLTVVPVESAVDLGLVARAYERLTDHAVEIAGRVIFAATGAVLAP